MPVASKDPVSLGVDSIGPMHAQTACLLRTKAPPKKPCTGKVHLFAQFNLFLCTDGREEERIKVKLKPV